MSSASSLCNPSDKLQALLLLLLLPPFVHSLSSSSSNWIWIRWFSLFVFYSFFIWLNMGLLEEITVNSGEKSHLPEKVSSLNLTPPLVFCFVSFKAWTKRGNKHENNPLEDAQKKDNMGQRRVRSPLFPQIQNQNIKFR